MTVKIKVNGPIISSEDKWFYDWFNMEATCPKDVLDLLPENSEDIEITINSGGGLVDMGNEIYTALRSHQGNVKANVVMAGSAASIIAMSADEISVSPVGQIMIHNVQLGVGGDYHDMDKASEILQKANQSLANAYVAKTGKSKDEILKLMDNETWLTAEEAVELGFADSIMFESNVRELLVADSNSGLIPNKIINQMKSMKNQKNTSEHIDERKLREIVNDSILQMKKEMLNVRIEKTKKEEQADESPFAKFLF